MKIKSRMYIVSLILVLSMNSIAFSDDIVLSGDDYCPHECFYDPGKIGYMDEITQYIFEQAGHTVTFVNVPWTRALLGARHGAYDGIVAIGLVEGEGFYFPDQKQGVAKHAFFTMANSHWEYKNVASMESQKLGAIQDYSYGTFYYRYIEHYIGNKNKVALVSGDDPLERNVKKLIAGRVDVVVEEQAVFQNFKFDEKFKVQFRLAGVADEEDLYVAFSPKKAKSIVYKKILSEGMIKIRQSGKLKEILSRYHITGWEQ